MTDHCLMRTVELVRSARDGDRSAFAELVAAHQNAVFALACQHAPDRTEAEDITQETFLRAYRDLRKLRRPERFTAWVYGIALNVARERNRKARPLVPLESIPEPEAPAANNEGQRKEQRLLALVAELPDKYRVPLAMRYAQALAYDAIGKALGVAEPTARSLVHRARAMLREQMERGGD